MAKKEKDKGEPGHPFTARLPQGMYDELVRYAEEDARTVNLEIQYLLRIGLKVERRRRENLRDAASQDDLLSVFNQGF